MAKGAPKGNQFWQVRTKHGRDKIFATPEIMWEAACEYFQWCIDNPLIEVDYRGTKKVELPRMRAFTIQGLTAYLHVNTVYFNDFYLGLTEKTDNQSKDFSKVIGEIRETVYRQKFEGASAGFLNANLISRDLGLADRKHHEGTINLNQITGMEIE